MSDAPLIRIPEVPIPAEFETRYVTADDGARLRVAVYPHPQPKAAIIVHPGWTEFIEKYVEVARMLHARGFTVLICDPRGQGYSQRQMPGDDRGLIKDFRRFGDDLDTHFSLLKSEASGPYFILGHSMGGLATIEWLASRQPKDIAGAVLSAPMTRLFANPFVTSSAYWVLTMLVALGQGGHQIAGLKEQARQFEGNTLTKDKERHDRFRLLLEAAPEARTRRPAYAWLKAGFDAVSRIGAPGALDDLCPELLLVSADDDETVDPIHHRELAKRYPQIALKRIPDAYHEILMEVDPVRAAFWQAFDDYVAARLPGYVPPADKTNVPLPASSA